MTDSVNALHISMSGVYWKIQIEIYNGLWWQKKPVCVGLQII